MKIPNRIYLFFQHKKSVCVAILMFFSIMSCEDNLMSFENTPRGNFEALWTIIDRNYCFFEYKNIDWNAVKTRYSSRVSDEMDNDALFKLLAEMLSELRDGHVNLVASHDVSRYWEWREDYPTNFNADIQKKYLGRDFGIAGGLRYKILEDNVGYIYYGSFSSNVSDAQLSQVISRMAVCKGIIFDVRNNGGGNLTNVDRICSRFFNEKTLIGYIAHKIGTGHNDFSDLYPQYIRSYDGIRYQKPIVVLTNRGCYSATNQFVNVMKYAPHCTILGDYTGGGSGLPFSSELPNGWSIRFSASPMFDAEKNHIEFGVAPDVHMNMTSLDIQNGKDTYIEKARQMLQENQLPPIP